MFASPKGLYRVFLVIFLLILSGIAFFRGYYKPENFPDTATWLPTISVEQGFAPILGKHEDRGRLYFPPKASNLQYLSIAKYVPPLLSRPRTPLFIGFTNNNPMLIQCVLSYIAAGWPPSDIIVVENTPTMNSNARGKLDRENYFFLDYDLLRSYGVSILQTPVLFTFSQLQNFYIRTALAEDWPNFFWSHMDVLALSDESPPLGSAPFKPFYHRIVDVVNAVQSQPNDSWAIKWFSCTLGTKACDMLVLVNVHVWATKIGAWDPFIPFYITDCDAFSRMVLSGYTREMANDHDVVGHIFDVGALLPDEPKKWLFPSSPDEQPNSERFQKLFKLLEEMEGQKLNADGHRNDWQENHKTSTSTSSEGEKAWDRYDSKAFRAGWWALSDAGRAVYDKKWGTDRCELETVGKELGDMWVPLYKEMEAKKEDE